MIIIDSSYLIALFDKKDKHHSKSLKLFPEIERLKKEDKIISLLMLSETLTYINSKIGGKFTKELYDTLKDEFTIYYPSKNEIDLSVNLILKYNGTLSLADCLAMVIMEKLEIINIYSFDSDFDKEGIIRKC